MCNFAKNISVETRPEYLDNNNNNNNKSVLAEWYVMIIMIIKVGDAEAINVALLRSKPKVLGGLRGNSAPLYSKMHLPTFALGPCHLLSRFTTSSIFRQILFILSFLIILHLHPTNYTERQQDIETSFFPSHQQCRYSPLHWDHWIIVLATRPG